MSVRLDTSVLDRMTVEAGPKASKIVQQYGWAITGEAAQNAPVEFGALRNSYLSESHMENDLLFILQDGVEYGIFQELGTSKMAAQPHVIPAVEAWEERFTFAFADLFK